MSLVARDLAVAPPGAPDPVVRGFSLEVRPGQWVALSGANGSGKSSVALALAGLWPAWAGEVTLGGEPIAVARDRGAVAAILQDPASQLLEPTVAEELAFTARNLALPEETIAAEAGRWAACFGLEPDLARDPRALSAGRQQLVLIAAALVARPQFLAADEAGAHLDAEAREQVLAALRREVEDGLGVLWVTQDAVEIARADRAVALGEQARDGGAPPFAAPLSDTVALRIEVTPWSGAPGPHVNTAVPLTIEVPATGVTALVGGNGAGKSVLLSCAAGLLRLDQVGLSPDGLDPPPIFSGQYPELQMFEEQVSDEIAFAAVSRGAPRDVATAEAVHAFERLALPGRDFLARRTFELSAGEKRLVQTVAALVTPAGLLLLDEPTAGLDTGRRLALAGLLAEHALRKPVLVASQDAEWLGWLGARRHAVGGSQPGAAPGDRRADPATPTGKS